jgi:hypothetical protein
MAYGGKFSSKEDLSGNRQALQVGRDFKPLSGTDKVWADLAGMNEDGSWNDWGKARTQIMSWFTGGAPVDTFHNMQAAQIMRNRNDDYGRAYDQHGETLESNRQSALWNRDIQGGLATAEIVSMGSSSPITTTVAKGLSEGDVFTDALGTEGKVTADDMTQKADELEGYTTHDDINVVDATGYGLSEQDRKALSERTQADKILNKAGGSLVNKVDPVNLALQQNQRNTQNSFANNQSSATMAEIEAKQQAGDFADKIPVVGEFAASIYNQDIQNDVWSATMNDAINRLDRSFMLDSGEYMS